MREITQEDLCTCQRPVFHTKITPRHTRPRHKTPIGIYRELLWMCHGRPDHQTSVHWSPLQAVRPGPQGRHVYKIWDKISVADAARKNIKADMNGSRRRPSFPAPSSIKEFQDLSTGSAGAIIYNKNDTMPTDRKNDARHIPSRPPIPRKNCCHQ